MQKSRSWIDIAIWAVAALTVVTLGYLGYRVWAQKQYNTVTSPAGRAVANLEKIVRKKPSDPGARVRLAQAYTAANRRNDAVKQYTEALRLSKDYPDALVGLGKFAMADEKWSEASKYWRRLIEKLEGAEMSHKDERLEAAYYYLGAGLVADGKHEDAIPYLKEALRIRPDASDTHYTLSIAYRETGALDKSAEELRITLLFDPKMPEANYDMGQLVLKQGKSAEAATYFRISADGAPNIDKPKLALAAFGSAADHVKKAQELATSNITSATAEVRIAVAIEPGDATALRLLGQLCERQKNTTGAVDAYQKLLKVAPDDKAAQDAVKRLEKNGGK